MRRLKTRKSKEMAGGSCIMHIVKLEDIEAKRRQLS
jgi:hypothetical protein